VSDDGRVGEIVAAWRARRDRGEDVDPEDVVREHPEVAADLRAAFAALRLLDRAVAGVAPFALPGADGDAGAVPPDGTRRIGDFVLLREIGRGATGNVYEAEQTSMRRRVALKILHATTAMQPRALERFRREAQMAGRLHHTHIVPVYAMGTDHGVAWFAMERIDGQPLSQVVADLRRLAGAPADPEDSPPPAPPPAGSTASGSSGFGSSAGRREFYARVARGFAGVADALAAAHAVGVVHRDVKPSNVLLDGTGTLKLLDFGLAKASEDGVAPLTLTGDLVGTPAYMSPEQVRAESVDGRTDVYGLGATLYEVLTLSPPFRGRDVPDCLRRIVTREPTRPRVVDPRVPRDLETIVLKAMEKDPSHRYASAADLARDLLLFADGATIQARRAGPIGRAWRLVRRHKARSAAAAVLVLALAGAGVLAMRLRSEQSERERDQARLNERAYLDLCASAEDAVRRRGDPTLEATPRDLYGRAIALLPRRYEAYFGRAMVDAPTAQDLEDLDAAAARGAPPRTLHLARAYVLRDLGRAKDADAETAQAARHPETVESRFLESQIAAARGDRKAIVPLLDSVVRDAPRDSAIRYLARRTRSALREGAGDWTGALEDLLALRDAGDRTLPVRLRVARAWRRTADAVRADEILAEAIRERATGASEESWQELLDGLVSIEEWSAAEVASTTALAQHPTSTRLVARRANALGHLARIPEAIELLRDAVKRAPEGHVENGALGQALLSIGDFESALAPLRQAVVSAPDCAACPMTLANALRSLGRWREAVDAANESLKRRPGYASALEARGQAYVMGGQLDLAQKDFEAALEDRPTSVMARNGLGDVAGKRQKWDEALREFDRAIAMDPTNVIAWREKGSVLRMTHRVPEALAAFEKAEELDHEGRPLQLANTLSRKGEALFSLDRYDEAIADLERARTLDPKNVATVMNLGAAYAQNGKPEKGLEMEDLAIERLAATPDPYPFVWRSGALMDLKRYAEALESADRAIALREDLAMAHWRRGQALEHLDRTAEAIPAFRRAVQIEPATSPTYWEWLGQAYVRAGKADGALDAFENVLRLDATSTPALNGVAWGLMTRPGWKKSDGPRATLLAERLVKAMPAEPNGWNTLGIVRLRAGDPKGAIDALTKSVGLSTTLDVTDALPLALAHAALGEREKALEWHKKALTILDGKAPTDPVVADLLAEANATLGAPPK
jgi:tetratricopeptide (TPR) repeat protein/tRNA A-37 threonylcarbamoyl transferase component Bud32